MQLACDDGFRFEEPQPAHKPNLKKIPGRLIGKYLRSDSSRHLIIDPQHIIEWENLELKLHIDSLDLEIDSTQLPANPQEFIELLDGSHQVNLQFIEGDSVLVRYNYRDTLFTISEYNVIRRFKGHYFLNRSREGRVTWSVDLLTLKKRKLSLSDINIPKDITSLEEITEIEKRVGPSGRLKGYKLKPTRRELNKLMDLGFTRTAEYIKVE